MPFLRILRDKRGYETSYLMHWFREGNRQRSRVLYVFRTPGGVRVGRELFDRGVLREIESRYPDIDFDWDAVRQNQQVIEATPDRRRRPRRESPEGAASADANAQIEAAPSPAAPSPQPAIPAAMTGDTPDAQIAFLTTWYPVVRARIEARTWEPERRDAMVALAERLNPAAWTDADEITTGLQQARETYERVARVLSRRRRRQRKRSRTADGTMADVPPSAAPDGAAVPDTAMAEGDDENGDDGEP